MLSNMESSRAQRPDDPGSVLAVAAEARQRLAAGLRLPAGLLPALAVTVAIQVGTAAYGIADQTTEGGAVALAGMALLLTVAALALHQFRRINGVRVDALASQIVLGSRATAATAYLSALTAATWAAFESRWWLVAGAAIAGGAGYSLGALRWWHAYRHDPAAHTGGATPSFLVVLAVLVLLGLLALMFTG